MLSNEINKLKKEFKEINHPNVRFQSIINQISATIEKIEQANDLVLALKKLRRQLKNDN